MKIQFTTHAMTFDAEVDIVSTARRATQWEPAEDFEIEITELEVEGNDAMFLLDSTLREDIEIAATIAAGDACDAERQEARIERYLDREYA